MHKANLINSGIIPLTFCNESDYDRISADDSLTLKNISTAVSASDKAVLVNNTKNEEYELCLDLSERARQILLAGGMLNYTANN